MKKRLKIHISYNWRLFIYIFLLILFIVVFLIAFSRPFKYIDNKYLNYHDYKNVDYKVYLKKNDFYTQDYLEKDMIYVASLIDKIDIDFNYDFTIEDKTSINFSYEIVGDLIITDKIGKTNYFEKEYPLLNKKIDKMINDDYYNINEKVLIDYDYYNRLANKFKSSYGLDVNSYLNVYLKVNKKSDDSSYIEIDDSVTSLLKIPLSERSVEIKFDSDDQDINNRVEVKPKLNNEVVILLIILLVVIILLIIKIIKLLLLLRKKKSNYDCFIETTLKNYDRLIVETSSAIDFKNKNIIKISSFNELLDMKANLKVPIMYYNVVSHQKSYFYIKDNNDIYLMKVKASDMMVVDNGKR